MKRILSLAMAIALIAACTVHDDEITGTTSKSANRVAGVTVVNEATGNSDSYIPHYDEDGRLFLLERYVGENLYDVDTLHFNTGSVIVESRNYTAKSKTFTELEMKDGLAVKRTVGGVTDNLSYKNGFLVGDTRYNREFVWKNGDYANYYWDGTTSFGAGYRIKVTYSWTAHNNIFASEEFDPSLVFGGYSYYRYYGKRCAHLPARVEYDYGEAVPLFIALAGQPDNSSKGATSKKIYVYSYTFDEDGRLSKISVTMKTEFFVVDYPAGSARYFDNGESVSTVYIKYAP